MLALFVMKLRRRERDRAERAAETKEERKVRLRKRKEADRACRDREKQREIAMWRLLSKP